MAIFSRNPTRNKSLAKRLFLFAAFGITILLTIAGVVLIELNKRAVESAFDRRLNIYVKLLITDLAINAVENEANIGNSLSEPLFELPQSGYYWQIIKNEKSEEPLVVSSRSLWDWSLKSLAITPELLAKPQIEGYSEAPDGKKLRVFERVIDLDKIGNFRIIIAANADDIAETTRPFNYAIIGIFAFLILTATIAAFFQVKFGLSPLRDLVKQLSLIRNGKLERFDKQYPSEIQPLTREINALLESNKEIVERSKTHVGNLAHALKTPLSVLQNEANSNDTVSYEKVLEQTDLMKMQVAHHLERAKLAARVHYVSTLLEIEPSLNALIKTMRRVHPSKQFTLDFKATPTLKWRGEQNDLFEMLGNLVDNAGKWAKSEVILTCKESEEHFTLTIDDDGSGLTSEQREIIGKRGVRLDESKPGSGLGLSIVKELVSLYHGVFLVEKSPKSGLRVSITLQKAVES